MPWRNLRVRDCQIFRKAFPYSGMACLKGTAPSSQLIQSSHKEMLVTYPQAFLSATLNCHFISPSESPYTGIVAF